MRTIAALFVDVARGPYATMPGVECWGVERDATTYAGPWPVVAHPPCGQWGALRHLARPDHAQHRCGPIAVAQVRRWGGVLEQPAHSLLWRACDLPPPGSLLGDGFSVEVQQVAWGHAARKRTWLWFVGIDRRDVLPTIRTGGTVTHWTSGTYTPGRRGTVPTGIRVVPPRLRHLTPPAFAAWLVALARQCRRPSC